MLAALTRRYGDLGLCEDAAQEAFLAATRQWPVDGAPDDPRAWLVAVGQRRMVDAVRTSAARTRRERSVATAERLDDATVAATDVGGTTVDDTLAMLLLCCDPVLTGASRVALTLRAVGGLTTAQIAAGYGVTEATMAQRISRAKAALRSHGRLRVCGPQDLAHRVPSVRQVLYLVFTEAHTTSAGPHLVAVSPAEEAIRLTRSLHRSLPGDSETTGLLALMLLTAARLPARTGPDGELVPLRDQDRHRWDRTRIAEGIALVTAALPEGPVGPYQLQAAIAAVHAEAPTWADTDWPQIVELYAMVDRVAPGPAVTLNRAVAVAMVDGPQAGLAMLRPLDADPGSARGHRLPAVRAQLLESTGDLAGATAEYAVAASRCRSIPEQRHLNARLLACRAALDGDFPQTDR